MLPHRGLISRRSALSGRLNCRGMKMKTKLAPGFYIANIDERGRVTNAKPYEPAQWTAPPTGDALEIKKLTDELRYACALLGEVTSPPDDRWEQRRANLIEALPVAIAHELREAIEDNRQ